MGTKLKFRYSEKATTIRRYLPLCLMLLNKFPNKVRDYFKCCGLLTIADFFAILKTYAILRNKRTHVAKYDKIYLGLFFLLRLIMDKKNSVNKKDFHNDNFLVLQNLLLVLD